MLWGPKALSRRPEALLWSPHPKPAGHALEPTGAVQDTAGAALETTGVVLEHTGIVLEPTGATLEHILTGGCPGPGSAAWLTPVPASWLADTKTQALARV